MARVDTHLLLPTHTAPVHFSRKSSPSLGAMFWLKKGHQATSAASQFQHPTNVRGSDHFPHCSCWIMLRCNKSFTSPGHTNEMPRGDFYFCFITWYLGITFVQCLFYMSSKSKTRIHHPSMKILNMKRSFWKQPTENNLSQGLNSSESMTSHPLRSCQDNLDFHANPRAFKIQHRI